ncbi:MAG: cell division protein FtsZ [Flavobacteriaceae bacterium]
MGNLNNNENNIAFDLPKSQSNTIKVIGVGGGGSNAVNHMFQQSIKGVDFVICNTDAQALDHSSIPNKIQLGAALTSGLGAGANPEVGKRAAEESLQDLQKMLSTQTKMVFITAGMGGGTGTGAAPIIASLAKEMNILTVGIVTMPFAFEGKRRMAEAKKGIEMLRSCVDSLIVINNNKLRDVYGNLGFKAGFSKADEVLSTAAKGIAEVITHHYKQNIDLNDAKRVLADSGTAIMGSAKESGQDRAQVAIRKALDSPLLNDNKITGAQNVLLLIVSGNNEVTLDEIGDINEYIQDEAGNDANIIMGVGEDETLEDGISVTVVATGFHADQQGEIVSGEKEKVVHVLGSEQKVEIQLEAPQNNIVDLQPKQVPTPTPQVEKQPKKIVYDLFEEEVEAPQEPVQTPAPPVAVIPEPEVQPEPVQEIEKPVSIMDMDVVDFKIVEPTAPVQEEVLTFEFPEDQIVIKDVNPAPEVQEELADVNVFNMEVIDPIEVVADKKAPTVVFDLGDHIQDDFTNIKPTIGKSSEIETDKFKRTLKMEEEEPMMNLELKVKEEPKVSTQEIAQMEVKDAQEVSPLNASVEMLRATREQRISKMKRFNYTFNKSNIEDMENVPAYKRQGLELNNKPGEISGSRTSISTDENDEIQLRSNNSFLHDNVD